MGLTKKQAAEGSTCVMAMTIDWVLLLQNAVGLCGDWFVGVC